MADQGFDTVTELHLTADPGAHGLGELGEFTTQKSGAQVKISLEREHLTEYGTIPQSLAGMLQQQGAYSPVLIVGEQLQAAEVVVALLGAHTQHPHQPVGILRNEDPLRQIRVVAGEDPLVEVADECQVRIEEF